MTASRVGPSKKDRVVGITVLVFVLIPVLLFVAWNVSWAGGPESIWLNSLPAPDQNRPERVQERAVARASIRTAFQGLERSSVLTPATETYAAYCQRGQNNYKVKEGYAHTCSITVGRFYGWSATFPVMARRLHAELIADGWETDYDDGLPGLAAQYETGLDPYSTPTPGVSTPPINFGWLWDTTYRKGGGATRLHFTFADRNTQDFDKLDYSQGISVGESWSDTRETLPSGQVVTAMLRSAKGVLLATIDKEYFEVRT